MGSGGGTLKRDRPRPAAKGLQQALGKLAPRVLFLVAPAALILVFLVSAYRTGDLGVDFQYVFWPAGHAVLHGASPYPHAVSAAATERSLFVYPPMVAIIAAPLAVIPNTVATLAVVIATIAALGGTLWILGVRDWRCYGLYLVSEEALSAVQTAALSAFLALGIAIAWRYRARGTVAPVVIAVVVAAKLFLLPLLLWLLICRGVRSTALATVLSVTLVMLPWVLGFPGLGQYPSLLSTLTDAEGAYAYTPRALAHTLGAGWSVSQAIAVLAGCSVLVLGAVLSRGSGGDRRLLALTIAASLLLSPLVWGHYFVVLLPLIAITAPRLSVLWFVPCGLWLTGGQWAPPSTAHISIALGVMLIIVAAAVRGPALARAHPWARGAARRALPRIRTA